MNISDGLRSKRFSPEWELAELRLLQRCFDLKFLKRMTRGQRKNQIEIDSPKWNSTPRDDMDGVVAAHIRAHAYVAWRRHVETIHLFPVTDYLAVSDTPPLADIHIDRSVSIIGQWLEWIVRVWNELGGQWQDLWDAFESPAHDLPPFLHFYKLCQGVRQSIRERKNTEMAKAIVTTLGNSLKVQRAPFEADGPEVDALRAAGVDQQSIRALPKTLERWQTTREVWEEYRELIKSYDSALSDPHTRPWASKEFKKRLLTIAEFLKINQVVLKVNEKDVKTGRFAVKTIWEANSVFLRPVISIGNLARLGKLRFAVTLHEFGHFVLHSSWQAELSLMLAVEERISTISPNIGNLIRATIQERSKFLVSFHSALEEAADEFALSVLLTDVDLQNFMKSFTDKDGKISIFIFGSATRHLGLSSGNVATADEAKAYHDRFWKLIDDRLQIGNPFHPKLIPTRDLRALMHAVSRQRVELLLESIWSEISKILKGEDTRALSRSRKATRLSAFSFEGITCN